MAVQEWTSDRHVITTALLGISVAVVAGVLLTHPFSIDVVAFSTALTVAIATVSGVLALYTARVHDGYNRLAWAYLGLGTLAWAVGEGLWFYFESLRGVEAPFPSLADASYLLGYPLLFAGVLQLSIPRRAAARVRTLLDAAVIAVVASAICWVYILEPIATESGASTIEVLLALSYPVGDLLLVFGLSIAVLRRPMERSGMILGALGSGLMLFLVADFTFAVLSQSGSFESGTYLDVMWLAGYGLIGTSAVWQLRWRVSHEAEDDTARVSAPWRQAIPIAVLLPSFIWAWAILGHSQGIGVPSLLTLALALVLTRSILTMTDVLALNKELDQAAGLLDAANKELSANGRLLNKLLVEAVALSRRDSLTGLLNHASIMDELARALKDHPRGVFIAMMDIDHMKRINDEGGHLVGDDALRSVATLLEAEEDLVAGRYGGDEFLVFSIARTGGLAEFEHVLDGVVRALDAKGIGLSHGIAAYPVDALDIAELIERADQRLYRSKRARKDAGLKTRAA